jgi:metallo-beta-lactamase family protein
VERRRQRQMCIRDRYYDVKATVVEIEGLSAHGDQNDLLNWLSEIENKPKKIFIVHGENAPADELRIKINEKYGWDCLIPLMGQEFEL